MSRRDEKEPITNIKLSHDYVTINSIDYVQLNISVENLSSGNVEFEYARMFINEGTVSKGEIVFDVLRTFQPNCEDCDLSMHVAQNSGCVSYPATYEKEDGKYRMAREISSLSRSVAYLYPRQTYETSVLFSLPSATVYEVTLVLKILTEYPNDCTCATHIIDCTNQNSSVEK
jgi:hypothetical protein